MRSGNKHRRPTAARREGERISRRNAILASALKVFVRSGFERATMDEIAAKARLAKGTLYLYFKSKEDLYTAIMLEEHKKLLKRLETIARKDATAEARLKGALDAYFEGYKKDRALFNLLYLSRQPMVCDKVSKDVLDESINVARACLKAISYIIDDGINAGELRPVDSWGAANLLWAMINGVIAAYEQDAVYREEIAGRGIEALVLQCLSMALDGLKAR